METRNKELAEYLERNTGMRTTAYCKASEGVPRTLQKQWRDGDRQALKRDVAVFLLIRALELDKVE